MAPNQDTGSGPRKPMSSPMILTAGRPHPPGPQAGHPSTEGFTRPQNPGDPNLLTTSIETIRSVARRAAEDPSPGVCAPAGGSLAGFLPRLAQLVTRLFTGNATGGAIRIVAQALAAFVPLLELGRRSPDPAAEAPAGASPEAPAEPELTTKDEARIDLLLQERAARARRRGAGAHRVRPDRPPEARATAEAEDEVWNDLLDLTSEALETFIRFRNAVGVERCLELLDLLAEAFAIDRPEAA